MEVAKILGYADIAFWIPELPTRLHGLSHDGPRVWRIHHGYCLQAPYLPTVQGNRVSLDCPGIFQGSRDLVHLSRDFGIFECMVMDVLSLWLHVQCNICSVCNL